jgi:hypothetical protein
MSPHNENLTASTGRIKKLITIAALMLLFALPVNAGRGFRGTDIITANGIGTPIDISSGPITVLAFFNPSVVDTAEHDIVSHWQGGQTGAQFIISLGGTISGGGNTVQWEVGCCGPLTGVYGNCGTIVPNQWYAVLLAVDANGKYAGSPAAGLSVKGFGCGGQAFREKRLPGGANLDIGGSNGVASFKGSIARVVYWNTILSPAEQTAALNGVSPMKLRRSSIVGWWECTGAGLVEMDYSGNKDDGILTGTTKAPHCPCEFPTN